MGLVGDVCQGPKLAIEVVSSKGFVEVVASLDTV